MPLDKADEVIEAIRLAADGVRGTKPDWLVEREQVEAAETRLKRYRRERV